MHRQVDSQPAYQMDKIGSIKQGSSYVLRAFVAGHRKRKLFMLKILLMKSLKVVGVLEEPRSCRPTFQRKAGILLLLQQQSIQIPAFKKKLLYSSPNIMWMLFTVKHLASQQGR